MKLVILILCLMIFSPVVIYAQKYRHKSETEIIQLTPAQRIDEWVNEQLHHRYDLSDDQWFIIRKHILRDGLMALPRLIEIINEYDPTKASGRRGNKGERFDACWQMLGYIDNFAVRLRGSDEGRRAIEALERSIQRMRAAGYGQPDQHDWKRHGRFDSAVIRLKQAKGINFRDQDIQDTFRFEYNIIVSDAELIELSNFLIERYPDYPSWSERNRTKDPSKVNAAGNSAMIYLLKKPERYYQAYLEFKKTTP